MAHSDLVADQSLKELQPVNWTSASSELRLNPHLPKSIKTELNDLFSQFREKKEMIWLSTSGSASNPQQRKLVALKKTAFMISAESVNDHLQVQSSDIWLNVLPDFHVGGLAIYARSFISKARVLTLHFETWRWNPREFVAALKRSHATLTSLVPTQIYDLVRHRISPPRSLRAVLVGGARLDKDLLGSALQLDWPVLPTYGMTECCSQIATACWPVGENPESMRILPHVEVKTNRQKRISIRSQALLTGIAEVRERECIFTNPLDDQGWFETSDLGTVRGSILNIHGREGEFVKVGGEGVHLGVIREKWQSFCLKHGYNAQNEVWLALEDPRLGHVIVVVSSTERKTAEINKGRELLKKFSEYLLPFEKPRRFFAVERLPMTSLGKVSYSRLLQKILSQ